MFGYNNGVIGGCIVLPSFHRDFGLPPVGSTEYSNVISNIVSFLQIGALAGSLLIFSVVRHFGRRWALGCGAGIFFIGSIMQVFSHGSLSLMYSGRAIGGIGLGCITVLVPMVNFQLLRFGFLFGISLRSFLTLPYITRWSLKYGQTYLSTVHLRNLPSCNSWISCRPVRNQQPSLVPFRLLV